MKHIIAKVLFLLFNKVHPGSEIQLSNFTYLYPINICNYLSKYETCSQLILDWWKSNFFILTLYLNGKGLETFIPYNTVGKWVAWEECPYKDKTQEIPGPYRG